MVRESIQFASPEGEGYVVAAADVLPSALTAEEYAEHYGTQLRERLPGYEELQVETIARGGGETAVIRSFRWSPPEAEPVAELHLYAVHDGRGIVARAGASADSFGELEPKLRELLAGVRLGPPAPLRPACSSRGHTACPDVRRARVGPTQHDNCAGVRTWNKGGADGGDAAGRL